MSAHQDYEKKINQEALSIIKETIAQSEALSKQMNMPEGDPIIAEKLNAMLARLQKNLGVSTVEPIDVPPWHRPLNATEEVAYIYLYNCNGLKLAAWEKMLVERAMREYSVNRPIYASRAAIEKLMREHNTAPYNHAYLMVAIKKSHFIKDTKLKDSLGQPLARVLEGSLQCESIIRFVHNKKEYYRNERGFLQQIAD